jgi:hypothetical protein
MPELRVHAVSSDGTRLVLRAADGSEYTLPIDDRLRAAVRGDRARLGQIEIELESQLRPRDIQARIRAGATAEEVAQQAGIPVDRVRRFEGPVLAERAFMAERAQGTPLRRQGESNGPLLGDLVNERLHQLGADMDGLEWDSWRRDDGAWEVVLAYRVGAEISSASWTFDPPRRSVAAADEGAQMLSGERPPTPEAPTYPFVPRIARLPNAVREEDSLTGLLDSVPGLRSDRREAASPVEPPNEPREPREVPAPAAVRGAAATGGGAAATGAGSAYEDALLPRAQPNRDRLVGTTDRQAEADGVRPGRRATVPSWDEIVFGSRRKKRE